MYRSPVVVTAALYSLPHAICAIGLPAKDWINAGTSYELKCKRYLAGMRNGKHKRPLTQIKTEKDAFTCHLKTLSFHLTNQHQKQTCTRIKNIERWTIRLRNNWTAKLKRTAAHFKSSQLLGLVYTKHQHKRCHHSAITLAIMFSLKSMETFENGLQTHSGASLQSCRSIDPDVWCKRALIYQFSRL